MKESRKLRSFRENDRVDENSDQLKGAERSKKRREDKIRKGEEKALDESSTPVATAVETPTEIVEDTTTRPISVETIRQKTEAAVEKSESEKKKFKPTNILGKFFDSLSDETKNYILGQMEKRETEGDINMLRVLQENPIRYVKIALEKQRSGPEKILLKKIEKEIIDSISRSRERDYARKQKHNTVKADATSKEAPKPQAVPDLDLATALEVEENTADTKQESTLEKVYPALSKDARKYIEDEMEDLGHIENKYKDSDKVFSGWATNQISLIDKDPLAYYAKLKEDTERELEHTKGDKFYTKKKAEIEKVIAELKKALTTPETRQEKDQLGDLTLSTKVAAPSTPEQNPQAEKERALAELKEIIAKANQRLLEIEAELKAIEAREKAREQATIKETGPSDKTILIKKPERIESQTFSKDFIKARISNLLETSGQVSNIQKLEVVGLAGEISIQISVTASGFDIGVDATIGNSKDSITLKNYNIDANFLAKGTVKKKLTPYLDKIPELLKTYIEKETGKKVASMRVEGGELKVTF